MLLRLSIEFIIVFTSGVYIKRSRNYRNVNALQIT